MKYGAYAQASRQWQDSTVNPLYALSFCLHSCKPYHRLFVYITDVTIKLVKCLSDQISTNTTYLDLYSKIIFSGRFCPGTPFAQFSNICNAIRLLEEKNEKMQRIGREYCILRRILLE